MKLVSLNIYGGVYLDRSISRLKEVKPDVLCLQELHEGHIKRLQEELELPYHFYVPGVLMDKPNKYGFPLGTIGLGILSRVPLSHTQVDYYNKVTEGDALPIFDDTKPNDWNRALISAEVPDEAGLGRVSTTHFTWTHNGLANDLQRQHVATLLGLIEKQNIDILAGDFNSVHGAEIMAQIGEVLEDHMPSGVETTIDGDLHRCRGLKIVVDNIFTRRGLAPQTLEFQAGFSDHKALIAQFLTQVTQPVPEVETPDL